MKAKYFFFAKLGMWLVARRVMVDFEKEEVNAQHLRIDNKSLTKLNYYFELICLHLDS